MPDSRLPRWARLVKHTILFVCGYWMAVIVGLGDILQPSTVIREVSTTYTPTGAYVAVAFALHGAAGLVFHRWRWEWVATSVLAFALLSRSVPVWASLDLHPERLSAAAGMTMGAGLMAMRATEMWWFACKTGLLVSRRRRREAAGGTRQGES